MRITGGELAGRRIRASSRGTRPTTDRIREALFSIIAARVPGSRFLDLFAGSGAVGFEAWSRGAGRVCWVEADCRAVRMLRENADSLGISDAKIHARDAISQLAKGFGVGEFDIIFADPPYEWDGKEIPKRGVRKKARNAGACSLLAELVRANGHLAQGGLLIIERGADASRDVPAGWRLIDRRRYGKSVLLFFCQEDSEP